MEDDGSATDQPRLPPELWFLIFRYATYPPFPWTTSSSNDYYQNSTTLPFHIRLTNYTSELKWKASLTRVCKEWNIWGQEFLWGDIWIASANDGKFLVGLVGGHQEEGPVASLPVDTHKSAPVGKQKQSKVGFALKSLKRVRDCPHSHLPISPAPSPSRRKNVASYIKKLRIETPSIDRCCLIDLMSILERCERLEVLIDLRSIRTGFGFVGVGAGRPVGFDWKGPPIKQHTPSHSERPGHHRIASDPILQALPQHQSTLKHLTFTNYKHDPDDPQGRSSILEGCRRWSVDYRKWSTRCYFGIIGGRHVYQRCRYGFQRLSGFKFTQQKTRCWPIDFARYPISLSFYIQPPTKLLLSPIAPFSAHPFNFSNAPSHIHLGLACSPVTLCSLN